MEFPELTSFGTLLKFALALEETAAELARAAGADDRCAPWRDHLAGCAGKHDRRAKQLERLRRERLNEVVLQRIEGLNGADYAPTIDTSKEKSAEQMIAEIVGVEDAVARFYDDAADIAANVLGGVTKTFKKLARESRLLAGALQTRP